MEESVVTSKNEHLKEESINQRLKLGQTSNSELEKTMEPKDFITAFSGPVPSYCVGMVDIVDSSRIIATLDSERWMHFYRIFLNYVARLVGRFGGVPIKNTGDGLLYYFPDSSKPKRVYGFMSCIEAALAIIEHHKPICDTLKKEGLPCLDFRLSADYGTVMVMNQEGTENIDLFGPPVNMCSKINHSAEKNGFVIGGDLYQMISSLNYYSLKALPSVCVGFKFSYPVYSVRRRF